MANKKHKFIEGQRVRGLWGWCEGKTGMLTIGEHNRIYGLIPDDEDGRYSYVVTLDMLEPEDDFADWVREVRDADKMG
jgi:hypothetical protein